LVELHQYVPRGFKARGVPRSQAASVETMSDARENGDRDKQQANEAALSARLQRLNESLGHARHAGRGSDDPGADRAATASGYAKGFRLSSELVAGVVVGAGLGWLIDRWLGISPWGLMIFLLLGFAAGVLNVMRTAGLVAGTALDDRTRGNRDK
jgi:ATP synthase protein I